MLVEAEREPIKMTLFFVMKKNQLKTPVFRLNSALFDSYLTGVRLGFGSCSGSVRELVGNGSGSVRELFDSDSAGEGFCRRLVEALSNLSRRCPKPVWNKGGTSVGAPPSSPLLLTKS